MPSRASWNRCHFSLRCFVFSGTCWRISNIRPLPEASAALLKAVTNCSTSWLVSMASTPPLSSSRILVWSFGKNRITIQGYGDGGNFAAVLTSCSMRNWSSRLTKQVLSVGATASAGFCWYCGVGLGWSGAGEIACALAGGAGAASLAPVAPIAGLVSALRCGFVSLLFGVICFFVLRGLITSAGSSSRRRLALRARLKAEPVAQIENGVKGGCWRAPAGCLC